MPKAPAYSFKSFIEPLYVFSQKSLIELAPSRCWAYVGSEKEGVLPNLGKWCGYNFFFDSSFQFFFCIAADLLLCCHYLGATTLRTTTINITTLSVMGVIEALGKNGLNCKTKLKWTFMLNVAVCMVMKSAVMPSVVCLSVVAPLVWNNATFRKFEKICDYFLCLSADKMLFVCVIVCSIFRNTSYDRLTIVFLGWFLNHTTTCNCFLLGP